MASIPHYMAQGVNDMTATGITKAVNGVEDVINLTITGVEEIVVFYIGMLTNTYLCLTTFAVTGSLSSVIGAIENAQQTLDSDTNAIGNDIASAATTVQNGINALESGINTLLGSSAPTVDFSSEINALKNLTLPDSLFADLQKLNNSLPTFQDVKNATETVIRTPFEDLKSLISREIGNYSINGSLFPVPEKKALTFCSDNSDINDFFDDLIRIEQTARKIFIAVLTLAAIAVCAPMAWWEIRRYRRLQERSMLIGKTATDPIDAVYMASRPFTSRIGLKLASRFSSPRKQLLVRWFVAYCTSLPALFILSLALAGLFACLCQYIMLVSIKKAVPDLTGQIANFANDVLDAMNNASQSWSNSTNAVITAENAKLNENIFGWVNTSTTAVNNTLNTFIDETMNVLNETFGGTVLYTPVKDVFECLVGLKVQGIQDGLTWVQNHASVTFPTPSNDTLSLRSLAADTNSTSAADILADPTGSTTDAVTSAVNEVTNIIEKGIRQEAIISTMILVAWLVLVLIGFVTAFVRVNGRDRVRGESGNEYNASAVEPYAIPVTRTIIPAVPRPESAAPPYMPNPDVNANGYTLNAHSFPRSNPEINEEYHEKPESATPNWPISRNLTGQQQHPPSSIYPSEKGGFI
jgi:hypothetical protein